MRSEANQIGLEPLFVAIDREDAAKAKLRAQQLEALDQALEAAGVHPSTTAYRLAKLIYHITKNNGDAFRWKAKQIAADPAMQKPNGDEITPRSVQRGAAQLRRLGIIDQRQVVEAVRGIDHVARSINWRNVARWVECHPMTTDMTTEETTDMTTDRTTDQTNSVSLYTSSPITQEPNTSTSQEATWEEAAEAVSKSGVSEFRHAIESARSAGVSPGYVLDCVAFHQEGKAVGAFDAGALYKRLRNAATFTSPMDPATWPARNTATIRVTRHVSDVIAWAEKHGKTITDVREVIAKKGLADGMSAAEIKRALFEVRFTFTHQLASK